MSVLTVHYKAYKAKLLELEKAYQVLNTKHTAVATFLTQDQQLFAERDNLRLAQVPMSEKLDSLKEKLKDANAEKSSLDKAKLELETQIALFKSHLENPELATMSAEEIQQKLTNLGQELAKVNDQLQKNSEKLVDLRTKVGTQERLVEENHRAQVDIEARISWVSSGKFNSNYTHGKVSQDDFNAYTDALKVAVKLRQELRTIETEISTLVKSPINPLKVKDNYKEGEREALVVEWDTEKAQQITMGKTKFGTHNPKKCPFG